MPKDSTLDLYRERLFDDIDQLQDLTITQRDQILRYRAIFTLKLEHPYVSNKNVAAMLEQEFGIKSISQAYRDIGAVERLLGNVRSSEKQFIRYLVVETLKEAIETARDNDEVKEMIAAADKLGKYARLDQEDQDPLPYEEIVPLPIEYVNDPEIMGRSVPPGGVKAFIERVKKKYIEAEDIEYEEVKHGQ